jgi:hypothetical protein
MKAFPPGFPFVSRNPEPTPEPEPAAAPQPDADASSESSIPPESVSPEPPAFAWRTQAPEPSSQPQPESARDPWPFKRRGPQAALPPETDPSIALTAPEREQPVGAAPAQAPAPAPARSVQPVVHHERRKVKRDALAAAALLRIDGMHGPAIKIELIDLSIAGARFRAPHKLNVGEKAQVRVEIGPWRWTTRLRVVHCSTLDDGGTNIGCAFLRTELLRPWPIAA